MKEIENLSKEDQKAMDQLMKLAESGNSRACLIVKLLEGSTPAVQRYHLGLITPMLKVVSRLEGAVKDPKFIDHIQKKGQYER